MATLNRMTPKPTAGGRLESYAPMLAGKPSVGGKPPGTLTPYSGNLDGVSKPPPGKPPGTLTPWVPNNPPVGDPPPAGMFPVMGGNLPAQTNAPPLSGNMPTSTPFPVQPTSVVGNPAEQTYIPALDEANITLGYLNDILSSDSALMRDARTRGIEQAASSGLQNSSIAAGASQRAALESALPLVQQSVGMFNDREQRQWTSRENQLDRDQQVTMSEVTNWLNNESFMREFNANLAMFPIQNTTQLLSYITQQSIDNPEVYTPDIISGMSEFFTTNFLDVLSRYFPSMYNQDGTGG